jgi:acetolactate synthase I/III small subunit
MPNMMNTLVVYVENKPGVLNRVASLFRRRGFNIESLTVGHTEKQGISRMTISLDTDERGAFLVEANLYKLVNVISVENITARPSVYRELAMIKVAATAETRTHLMQLVSVFRARVVDVAPDSLVIEITGTEDKIDGLLEVLMTYGVIEMVRTGRVAISRGTRTAAAAAAGANGNGKAKNSGTSDDGLVSYSV